ncbi:MAG: flagellar basal-body rod protein FlgF [Gammaproteobacteria bacterium]|nr:flagellar basal-body rod protein FlgF [Gammaproteobacteria bacterium]MDH4313242.1 flagellar basal-body rod protein FlgF [Gammaproteobacteria bacterium]MDH5213552.1 flagellar basal-body rod protein FlgF [Gammaproteobacteria bacterium]
MDEMIYLAMTGAKQTEYAQAINSNNLANISTTGFRADLHAFSSLPIEGPGVDSRVNAIVESYGTDFSQAAVANTGRDLDIAIQGRGFIAVQAPDGSEAYTRAGDLRIGSGGLLSTGAGHLVMGEGGPLAVPPHSSLLVGADGTVSIQALGQGPETLSIVDRIKLVDPDTSQLSKGRDGLLRLPEGETAGPSANVRVTAGSLEQSNVNIARTLVNMIELSRQYEMQINVIKTSKEDADAAAQMMRVG